MMRRYLSAGTVIALLALSMTACSAGTPSSGREPGGPVGTWGPGGEGNPQMVLDDSGSMQGTDGCNQIFGDWTTDGAAVQFRQIGSTRMYCEGVDTWLSGVASATVDGDAMAVFDEAGTQIGTLERQ